MPLDALCLGQIRGSISNVADSSFVRSTADYEISFLRLLDKLTNGSSVEINHSGTALMFKPGLLSVRRKLEHDCGVTRSIGYYLESVIMLAPFAKNAIHLVLKGITNDTLDPSVDVLRTVTLPLLKKFGLDEGLELKVRCM